MKNLTMKSAVMIYGICVALVAWAAQFVFPGAASGEECVRAKEYYRLGTKLLDYQERKAAFEKSVQLCPSLAEAHVNLADALENLAARVIYGHL